MEFDFIYEKAFWKDTFGRAVYTMIEAFLGVLGGQTVIEFDWRAGGAIVLTAGIATVGKCVVVACKKGFKPNDRPVELTMDEVIALCEENPDLMKEV